MAKPKRIKYLVDEVRDGGDDKGEVYVRAWAEGRSVIVVQVWLKGAPNGNPDGDWEMPRVLGVTNCIDQAILQT